MSKHNVFPFTTACLEFIKTLYNHPLSMLFKKPYKPQKDDDYFDIIHKPMDLSTIQKKLLNGEYVSLKQWENEVRLIYKNSILYNGETHLLGGISTYFLKKIDKFMEKVESSNSRNFEEKTKRLYSEILNLLREMPAIEIEYLNDTIDGNVNNNEEQNIKNDNIENIQDQKEENQINDINPMQNIDDLSKPSGYEQNEGIKKIEEIYVDDQEMFPFNSLNPQGYGEFDKQRMRQIRNDLNGLISSTNINDIIMLIHNSDVDFRCFDIKEIDVASMSRRTLVAIEEYVRKMKNSNSKNDIDNKVVLNDQSLLVKPANHENSPFTLNNSKTDVNNDDKNDTTIINITIHANHNKEVVSENKINNELNNSNNNEGNSTSSTENTQISNINSSVIIGNSASN